MRVKPMGFESNGGSFNRLTTITLRCPAIVFFVTIHTHGNTVLQQNSCKMPYQTP